MAVFLFDLIAILVFLRFADRSRMRELLPLVLASVFLRFLEHFVIIDWLKIWTLAGAPWRRLWLPILADLTVWPVAAYLYIQYVPKTKLLLYTTTVTALLWSYIQALDWLGVITREKHWILTSFVIIFAYFWTVYFIWRWLRQGMEGGAVQDE